MAHEYGLKIATAQYIDALYYHDTYRSPACWMDVKDVNLELKSISLYQRIFGK